MLKLLLLKSPSSWAQKLIAREKHGIFTSIFKSVFALSHYLYSHFAITLISGKTDNIFMTRDRNYT
jgi:hypothetical protein